MKRLEIILPANKLNLVISAIEDVGVGGMTVTDSRGRGRGSRPSLGSLRGTSTLQAEYNNMVTIMTVVGDSQVDGVVEAVLSVASTGSSDDGKIFIMPVEESVDIQTKSRGKSP